MGATTTDTAGAGVRQGFNPRAHEGRDSVFLYGLMGVSVSTHAPTRGATPSTDDRRDSHLFQPTRPRGARRGRCGWLRRAVCFNPRAHEGRDFWPRMTTRSSNCFNPRAHEGRDPSSMALARALTFQPTRPRGARRTQAVKHTTHDPFQPTRPRGARH